MPTDEIDRKARSEGPNGRANPSGDGDPPAASTSGWHARSREELVREVERLQAELERLGQEAIEQGGLREQGEQGQYAQQRAHLEERIEALRRELSPGAGRGDLSDAEQAGLGRRYTIRLEDGSVETWELALPRDASPRDGRISVQSPLGRALLGKSAGQRARVTTPEDSYEVEVVAVG